MLCANRGSVSKDSPDFLEPTAEPVPGLLRPFSSLIFDVFGLVAYLRADLLCALAYGFRALDCLTTYIFCLIDGLLTNCPCGVARYFHTFRRLVFHVFRLIADL